MIINNVAPILGVLNNPYVKGKQRYYIWARSDVTQTVRRESVSAGSDQDRKAKLKRPHRTKLGQLETQ